MYILDMAAKIDATADFICKPKWGDVEFPPPFGREAYPEVRLWLDGNSDLKKKINMKFVSVFFCALVIYLLVIMAIID